jgi:hypothetical protein
MIITTPNITKFMPISKSIIFELNNNLRVYAVSDSVNQEVVDLQLIRELERDGKVLELADKFEILWQDLEESGEMEGVNEIYFLIGDRAGFTDTRMVYVWLKSWQMFNPEKQFYLHRISIIVTIDLIATEVLKNILGKAKIENNSSDINYSKEPNITNNFKG